MPGQALLVSARPDILVDGQRQPALGAGLTSLLIEETSAGLYRCEAVFSNWGPANGQIGFLYFDRSVLEFGKTFAIVLGGATLFTGRIGALEGRFPNGSPPEIAVLAEDRLQDLRMTRRTRHFESISDADVMQQIAREHGLSADVEAPGDSHTVLAQINQSDLAFLRERARAVGVELWVEDTQLKARARTSRAGSPVTLDWGGRLRSFTVLADLAHQATELTVGGWDVAAKQAIAAKADLGILSSELDGGTSGGRILQQALGERPASLVHGVPANDSEARATAEAGLKTLARRFVVGHGLADPDAALKVGASVRLEGLGALFSGQYVLSEVRHRFNEQQGLWTEFTAERAALGEQHMNPLGELFDARLPAGLGGRWYGVFPALVTDIKDPDGQGRVKISLPWAPDAQNGTCELWARVATLMGGNNRGSWFIPDVSDEVLVAFEGGDPRRPYVLGGLWNGQDTPPESMDGAGDNNKKVICSRNGVKITLDDQDGQEKMILETPGGQKVTLQDGPGSIELIDSNGNSVKLESSGITINCSARFSLTASSVEISASMVKVDAGMSKFSGIVQADTVISSTVISSTYTPGAGNIW